MRDFLQSPSGRLARVTLALGIITAGLVALAAPDKALYVIAGAPPFLIVGAFVAVGLAIAKHRAAAFAMTLVLPLVAGLYLAALYGLRGAGGAVGLALAAVGTALAVGTVVTPALRAGGEAPARPATAAGQH